MLSCDKLLRRLVIDLPKKKGYNRPYRMALCSLVNMVHDDEFLMISREMFRSLFTQEKASGIFNMKRSEHAFIAHRETKRCNEALIKMALAKDEAAVCAIFTGLTEDTVMALCSRWMNCYKLWMNAASGGGLRVACPANSRGLWRYIFLALIDDPELHTVLLQRLDREAPEVVPE